MAKDLGVKLSNSLNILLTVFGIMVIVPWFKRWIHYVYLNERAEEIRTLFDDGKDEVVINIIFLNCFDPNVDLWGQRNGVL